MYIPQLTEVNLFDPLIFKSHFYQWDWKKIEPLCEEWTGNTPRKIYLEQGNADSSVANANEVKPHQHPDFEGFYRWVKPIADNIMFKKWKLSTGFDYKIVNSWVNVHGEGGMTEIHDHGPTTLVITAYLNLPENGGFIQFKDPLEYHHAHLIKEFDTELGSWRTLPAKTGDVVMFPGWLRHRTQPNKSKEKRWVLTTNINCIITD